MYTYIYTYTYIYIYIIVWSITLYHYLLRSSSGDLLQLLQTVPSEAKGWLQDLASDHADAEDPVAPGALSRGPSGVLWYEMLKQHETSACK